MHESTYQLGLFLKEPLNVLKVLIARFASDDDFCSETSNIKFVDLPSVF